MIDPASNRAKPADRRFLTVAGIALLAAFTHSQASSEPNLTAQLAPALGTLIAGSDQETGPPQNQVLLLVRV